MQKILISPVNKEICIGYFYKIENESTDNDGHNSYTTIHKETKCENFMMEDNSGKIEIDAEGIELFMLDYTSISSNGDKRYSEIVIKENQELLLVGYANSDKGKAVISKNANILGITSVVTISLWNKYQPLLKSFLFTCFVIVILILIILF